MARAKIAHSISDLPGRPAVYALYGGSGRNSYVAYVGITGDLKKRITQHLIRRDSSVTTGTTAATLNPELVTEVRWWRTGTFRKKVIREAAEIIALEVLDPTLRSRGITTRGAREQAARKEFRSEMEQLFAGPAHGTLLIPDLPGALERLAELEARVEALETKLRRA